MRQKPKYLTMKELSEIELGAGRYTRIIPGKHLKYTPPSEGGLGWSMIPMLFPNSVQLFVGPPACGRHVKIAAYRHAFENRLFLFQISETDLVTGGHLARIPDAVAEILERVDKRPEVFYITSSCVDTIMGSDYKSLCKKLSKEYEDIRFVAAYMDPVMFDSKMSTDRTVFISLLEPVLTQEIKDRGINIIGTGRPLVPESELIRILENAGFGPIRQLVCMNSAGAADALGRSCLNIVCGPSAEMAARIFEKKHGIPYIMMPYSNDPDVIHRFYKKLGEVMGCEPDDRQAYKDAVFKLQESAKKCRGKKIAIGNGFFGNPFETANLLLSYGFTVEAVVKNKIVRKEMERIQSLAKSYPDIKVYSGDHPTLNILHKNHEPVDIAIGVDMVYYYPEAAKITGRSDAMLCGYDAAVYLAESLGKAVSE